MIVVVAPLGIILWVAVTVPLVQQCIHNIVMGATINIRPIEYVKSGVSGPEKNQDISFLGRQRRRRRRSDRDGFMRGLHNAAPDSGVAIE